MLDELNTVPLGSNAEQCQNGTPEYRSRRFEDREVNQLLTGHVLSNQWICLNLLWELLTLSHGNLITDNQERGLMTTTRGGTRSGLNYTLWLKRSFLGGFSAMILSIAILKFGPAIIGPLPGWEQTLFWDLSVIGLLVAFFSPFVFGIVLPLLE